MYVGGLRAAAGGHTSFVGQELADLDVPARGPRERHESIARAASGAARAPLGTPAAGWAAGRRRRRRTVLGAVVADVVGVGLAVLAAHLLGLGPSAPAAADVLAEVLLPVAAVGVVLAHGGYDRRFLGTGASELRHLSRSFVTLLAVVASLTYLADLELSGDFLAVALLLAVPLVGAARWVARRRLVRRRRRGIGVQRVVVAGRAASLQRVVQEMRRKPAAGLVVVGACLADGEENDPWALALMGAIAVPVLGGLDDVGYAAARHGADAVAVVAGELDAATVRSLGWAIENVGGELLVSSGLAEVADSRVRLDTGSGAPMLRVDSPRFSGVGCALKSIFDRLVAGAAVLLLSPVLGALALLVRFTSRGPAFYVQERIGRNGVPFRMIKFRSMYVGAEARVVDLLDRNVAEGPLFKIPDDPRVTPVGRWLRKFSIDELPQLINVVTGSMSLVGPRPPLPAEVEQYGSDTRRRLLVKPGLTGLWQVSGRSDLSWDESVRLDLHYVENRSFGLDLAVLAKTARVVVKATGAY